jgi:hypothetical protein
LQDSILVRWPKDVARRYPTGVALGQLTDETIKNYGPEAEIIQFAAIAPKSYVLKIKKQGVFHYVQKMKGMQVTAESEKSYSPEAMIALACGEGPSVIKVDYPHQIQRRAGEIIGTHVTKRQRVIMDKRILLAGSYRSRPFGFRPAETSKRPRCEEPVEEPCDDETMPQLDGVPDPLTWTIEEIGQEPAKKMKAIQHKFSVVGEGDPSFDWLDDLVQQLVAYITPAVQERDLVGVTLVPNQENARPFGIAPQVWRHFSATRSARTLAEVAEYKTLFDFKETFNVNISVTRRPAVDETTP